MWILYSWQRVRKFVGGKWGRVTGFLWGKRWVRLHDEAIIWDENWNIPQDCLMWRYRLVRITEDGLVVTRDLADPAETWHAIAKL